MNLSEHFTLEELTKSETALRQGIDNTPDQKAIGNLRTLALEILEPVRTYFKKPIRPSSGYRSLELNRALKSKDTSQHITGHAVDFEIPGVSNYELASWIRDNLDFDQLILEFYEPGKPSSGWVHCSYVDEGTNRNRCLTINKSGTTEGLMA